MSYNKGGYIGGGCVEGGDYGLTDFGKTLVKEFNKIGMLIDLSHCGPKVVADVLELSEKPVTIGHTCSKVLADNPRNKTDEQMKRLKENGGVIGMTPWAPICWKRKENVPPTIEDYLCLLYTSRQLWILRNRAILVIVCGHWIIEKFINQMKERMFNVSKIA